MLYPKREKIFNPEDFKNPSSEYRATPFWAWNNKLDRDELVWQIEQFKIMGFGGFHMHVRTGMATEYLSDEYMGIVRVCAEKARQEKMLAWLYDEDRWPSGAAGGMVTKNPRHRIRHLLLTRKPYGTPVDIVMEKHSRATSSRCENGELIACFDVLLDKSGNLESYGRIDEKENAAGFKLFAYLETALPNPWFNNQTYANTLDPETIREFIKVSYEPYNQHFKNDFGSLIPAIFTDEPQFSEKGTLYFAQEDRDITLPWTFDIEESYKAAYGGESLVGGIPELLWELPNGKVSTIRYRYHDHIAERFSAAFVDQCGAWCKERGIMLTGHMMEEPTLESQTHALGEAMRSYRSFQLPGIDMLCDRREFTTAKQAQSAARQNGAPGTLSEIYGVTNWNFDFRGHKLQGDWQAALGVTVRVPHLSWVSMNGEAKRDYPASFNYQSPWYREYPYVEDHFARLATALTRGRAVCRVGVIHPIESYWLHWGARENTASIRDEMDEKFLNLCDWLLRGLIDFDYICESTLARYCDIDGITSSGFPVGEMSYEAIIVPDMETIRRSTLERLEAFRKAGGRVLLLGDPPKYIDAVPQASPFDEELNKLIFSCEKAGFGRLPLLSALENVRDIDIRDSSGARTGKMLYQLREEPGCGSRWLFIAQADNPQNPDLCQGDFISIRIRGEWSAVLCETMSGEISALPDFRSGIQWQNGWTIINRHFYEHDSLLLKLNKVKLDEVKSDKVEPPKELVAAKLLKAARLPNVASAPPVISFHGPVPITLEEPNVLLLDMAEYALDPPANNDEVVWRPREEILKLDNALRSELNWPGRSEALAQPWVEHDASTPHTLKLRFCFESEITVSGTELALENAAITKITLNGESAGPVKGWYVDKCIGRVKLPEIKAGANVLEACFPYGRRIDVEAMYLLGDFGVSVAGSACVITKPVRALGFGDITRGGLPFYGGNLVYHLEAETSKDKFSIRVSNYRGHLLKIKVDGKDYGPLVYSPYQMEISAEKGTHRIDIISFGSRINTFGQLHCVERNPANWWGPNSWRTTGDNWSYEYQFWPQGILKSPEIG